MHIKELAHTDAKSHVEISGRFDAFSASKWSDFFENLYCKGVIDVQVDMEKANFIDSTGLAELVKSHKRLSTQGGSLKLGPISEPVTVILELTALDKVLT